MIELLSAAAMLLPLNPGDDHAVLAELIKPREDLTKPVGSNGRHPYRDNAAFNVPWLKDNSAIIYSWRGTDCESRYEGAAVDGWGAVGTIDWKASPPAVNLASGGLGVRVAGDLDTGTQGPGDLSEITLLFDRTEDAKAVYLAMTRIKAACTPQR